MMVEVVGRSVRVMVGDSVWEDASVTIANEWLHIEFEADDLDNISLPLGNLLGSPPRGRNEAS